MKVLKNILKNLIEYHKLVLDQIPEILDSHRAKIKVKSEPNDSTILKLKRQVPDTSRFLLGLLLTPNYNIID